MSLRPAQELVAESSKFSLRQFFETPALLPPTESTAEAAFPASASPTEAASPTNQPLQSPFQPPMAQSMPLNGAPRVPTLAAPKEAKFTFNGLMPTTTSSQLQHRLLAQHQQAAIQAGAGKPAPPSNDASEVLRLKAQVVTLNDRIAHLNTNLASTSESVVRGNKALTTERAQFHAKYAALTKKLETTSAALAEAEALPKEAVKNAKLLNAKILELQEENAQLAHTRASLEESLSAKGTELEELRATAANVDVELQSRHDDIKGKYEVLSAQHSLALEKQADLSASLETHQTMLEAASAEVAAVNEQLEASKVETAAADGLVEELDAKLSALRLEHATKAEAEAAATAAACCARLARCEALEKIAEEARAKLNGADAEDCEWLAEEHHFAQCMAKRARAQLEHGGEERVMVAHVFTDDADALDEAAACLDACVRHNPLPMGSPYEQSFRLARMGADGAVLHTGAPAANGTQSAVSVRTNSFVKAISEDLKFHMDDSQALYKSSSATGAALRI